jgi:hypothetical protein
MNPDEVDRQINVAFLEPAECEFINAMVVEDLRRITICLGLAAVLVRMKYEGDCIKEAFVSDDATIAAELNPSSP